MAWLGSVIKAISIWNNKLNTDFKVHFNIFGEGHAYSDLVKLSKELMVSEYVHFHGFKNLSYILPYYQISHIAIGSIGLFRKDLKIAAELKAREYCAIGIPFISEGKDVDFLEDTSFRITINGNNVEMTSLKYL